SFGVVDTDELRKAELIAKIKEQDALINAAKSSSVVEEVVSEEDKPKKRARTTKPAVVKIKPKTPQEEVSLFDSEDKSYSRPESRNETETVSPKIETPRPEAPEMPTETVKVDNRPIREKSGNGNPRQRNQDSAFDF